MLSARSNVLEMPQRPPLARRLAELPTWMNEDPYLTLWAPQLRVLLEHYTRLRGDHPLPLRSAFDPVAVPQHLGDIYLVHVEPPPRRYRYRLVGTRIAAVLGRDATGRYFDEVYGPDVIDEMSRGFDWVRAHRRPLHRYGRCRHTEGRAHRGFEELLLPFSRQGETVDIVLGRIVHIAL